MASYKVEQWAKSTMTEAQARARRARRLHRERHYPDVDPADIDPETGRPYANYSSPSLGDL